MSAYEENPFANPQDVASSQNQNSHQSMDAVLEGYDPFGGSGFEGNKFSGSTPNPAVMQPNDIQPPPYEQYSAAQRINTEDLRRRQEELDRKAAELHRREQELLQQESGAGRVLRNNNWPPLPHWIPLQPCFYQDFQVDIPLEFQRIVKITYYLWMFHVGILFMNVLGTLSYFIVDSAAGTVFGLSILYFILFTPGSFVCWYRPLYKAFRSDSSFNFMLFFFVFTVQTVASILQCIGFDFFGTCGFINSIETFSKGIGAGLVMLLVAIGFGLAAAADILLIIRIHRIYRASDASVSKAREEFASGMTANPDVQSIATDVAVNLAKNSMSNSTSGSNRF